MDCAPSHFDTDCLVTPADKTDNISFYRKNGFEVSGTESDGNVIVVKLFCEKKD